MRLPSFDENVAPNTLLTLHGDPLVDVPVGTAPPANHLRCRNLTTPAGFGEPGGRWRASAGEESGLELPAP
jgi:hypothetical protein